MTDHAGEKKRKPRNKFVDRRSGEDRRQSYNLDYFSNGGSERRTSDERRRNRERRAGWIRVAEWTSVCFTDDCAVR